MSCCVCQSGDCSEESSGGGATPPELQQVGDVAQTSGTDAAIDGNAITDQARQHLQQINDQTQQVTDNLANVNINKIVPPPPPPPPQQPPLLGAPNYTGMVHPNLGPLHPVNPNLMAGNPNFQVLNIEILYRSYLC